MQINPEIIEELILDAGEARAKKARNYKQAKKGNNNRNKIRRPKQLRR